MWNLCPQRSACSSASHRGAVSVIPPASRPHRPTSPTQPPGVPQPHFPSSAEPSKPSKQIQQLLCPRMATPPSPSSILASAALHRRTRERSCGLSPPLRSEKNARAKTSVKKAINTASNVPFHTAASRGGAYLRKPLTCNGRSEKLGQTKLPDGAEMRDKFCTTPVVRMSAAREESVGGSSSVAHLPAQIDGV